MSIPATRDKKHVFWKSYKEKRALYDSEEFNLMTEYIKQSYIEHPFMFEEQNMVNGVRTVKKIRSKFLSREEKNRKKVDYEKMMSNKHYYSYKLTNDLNALLSAFASPALLDEEARRRRYEIPDEKKAELAAHLLIDNF